MNEFWLLLCFLAFQQGALANQNASPDTSMASQAKPPSSSSTLSIPASLSTAVEEAHRELDGKAFCFEGNNTASLGWDIFDQWTSDFCRQTHEPLSPENGVYKSTYTQSTLAYDFLLHWDLFGKNCSGHRTIDFDTCYATLVGIEKECHVHNHGGTMPKDCVTYGFIAI